MLPGNIKATFLWAPYGTNLTAHFKAWCANPSALGLAAHGSGTGRNVILFAVMLVSQMTCSWQGKRHGGARRLRAECRPLAHAARD